MSDLDLLMMELHYEFDQIPQDCLALRHLWLRLITDVELARLDLQVAQTALPAPRSPLH